MKFVVSHLDQQLGPFDEQELKMKWAAGEILPIDYVYDEAKQDWILLADRFAWAAKPVKDDGSAPPPIREVNIARRAAPVATGPTKIDAPKPAPTPAAPSAPPVMATPVAPTPPASITKEQTVLDAVKETTDIIRNIDFAPQAPKKEASTYLKMEMMTGLPTIELPAPVVESAQTPPPPARPTVSTETKVTLVNGVAEIDLTPATPGHMELAVQDSSGIRSSEPLVINVRAAEPVEVRWQYPSQQVVGEDVHMTIEAIDDRGHVCEHYNDQFLIQIRGPVSHDHLVTMTHGRVIFTLKHTKAECWSVTLHYSGTRHLRLPEGSELDWRPGPAVKLVLDGPHEYLAGDAMKVRVKAVDAYGNTADNYQGVVSLAVKAS
jgi:hypothetical protein